MRALLAALLALALLAPAAAAAAPRASLTDIEDEVMCLECGTALNVSNSAVADQEREFIAELIAQGKTKQQVKDALVAEYGPRVLAEPSDDGFELTAWLVPLLGGARRARARRVHRAALAARATGRPPDAATSRRSTPTTRAGSTPSWRPSTGERRRRHDRHRRVRGRLRLVHLPCVLPLVPGYLSAVSGVSVAELQKGERSLLRVLLPAIVFCLSFTVVFVALGMTATGLGSALQDSRGTLDKVAGAVIIALGVLFVLTPFVPKLNREWRPDALISRAGSGGPLIAGAAFAFAWTPCIGPTLGAILTAASTQDALSDGAVLLLFYSLGLSVPFLLTALAFTRAWGAFRWLRDRYVIITARLRAGADRDGGAAADRRADAPEHRGPAGARLARAEPLRRAVAAVATSCSGAVTPSRPSDRAITRCVATQSASRNDSSASGSAPTTRQSR